MDYLEEIDYDPFLCDDCQQFGYCRKRSICIDEEIAEVVSPLQQMPSPFSDDELQKWITEYKWEEILPAEYANTFKEGLFLFNKKRYQQAANTFLLIMGFEDAPMEIRYGLAVCLFFQKDPVNAAVILSHITEPIHKEMRLRFLRSCEIQKRIAKLKVSAFLSTTPNIQDPQKAHINFNTQSVINKRNNDHSVKKLS